jgi:hypothetical protein
MWQCVKCHQHVEDQFDTCWQCGTSRDGTEDPDFSLGDEVPPEAAETLAPENDIERNPIECPRCREPLSYIGSKAFHEGTRWGLLGGVGELFVNRERFDVYCCPRCGRVEFFVDGIGEEFRPQ